MATRNATPQFTFEEWRVEFNQLAGDVGDIESGITGSVASGASTYTTVETALEALFTDINSIVDGTYGFSGSIEVTGDLTVTGDTIIGTDSADTITINSSFGSGLIPDTDASYDLGSVSNAWNDLYLAGNATIEGYVDITNATGSTSDETGALIVGGGAGIGENLYVGGNIFENDQPVANQGFAIAIAIALS